ncbi:MAG TPA: OsmC family protein, partial [Sunxiuqinia sp.]|nr:OsmC family protein [Sunxiuqinia sp.]
NMQFDAEVSGHKVVMDATPEVGGNDIGARPKQLMMAALAGCTGMDVISMLKKMRVKVDEFDIDIEADMTEEHPKHYYKVHIIYKFKGQDLDEAKLKKAVDLSQDRYCGVSFTYRQTMDLTYEIVIL